MKYTDFFDNAPAFHKVYNQPFNPQVFAKKLSINPITHPANGLRPYSISFEGGSLGDEGKGSVVAREIEKIKKKQKNIITYRWNGGSNAGHEVKLKNGNLITLHQFPTGILYKGVTAIIGKGMVFHPGDALVEKEIIEHALGKLPGILLIDANVGLSLDTHRALETLINNWYIDYSGGSTGRGISTGYADELLKTRLTLRDLLSPEWRKKFIYHYTLVEKHLNGFGFDLKDMKVITLKNPSKNISVGTRSEFIQRLAEQRKRLLPYISTDIYTLLRKEWNNDTPFIFEGANGIGHNPRHGVYPDVSSSEPRARGIQDATEGVVDYKTIAFRCGVIKGPYMSSVGVRRMPGELAAETEVRLRNDFSEFGKTSGRPRGVLPVDIPALKYWRSISDYEYLVVTHMDVTLDKITVVINYKDEKGNIVPFRPHQWYLDTVYPEFITVPGWDGKKAIKAKSPDELPENALRYLKFLELALQTKIAWITIGQEEEKYVSWLPEEK